jgi:hypothetical protein
LNSLQPKLAIAFVRALRLALPARILALLSGFLATTLLLAGLLARLLILLAWILVRVGHRVTPFADLEAETTWEPEIGCAGTFAAALTRTEGGPAKTISAQALRASTSAVAAPGSHC